MSIIGILRINPLYPPYLGPPRDEFETLSAISQSCPNVPECNRFGESCFEVGTIPAGESRSCIARVRAIRKREAPQRFQWVTYHFENQAIDSFVENNSTFTVLSIAEAPLSVPLSPWAKSLLILALMALGTVHLQKRQVP